MVPIRLEQQVDNMSNIPFHILIDTFELQSPSFPVQTNASRSEARYHRISPNRNCTRVKHLQINSKSQMNTKKGRCWRKLGQPLRLFSVVLDVKCSMVDLPKGSRLRLGHLWMDELHY